MKQGYKLLMFKMTWEEDKHEQIRLRDVWEELINGGKRYEGSNSQWDDKVV